MPDTTVRPASAADLPAAARLRWHWVAEENGATDVLGEDEFVETFVAWSADHADTHRCFVAERDGVVLGMAWLALTARVPSPRAPHRLCGDLQCGYVVPDARDQGLGTRLVEAVVTEADRLGVERLVVHSSERAVPAYDRAGFVSDTRLRHRHVRPVGARRDVAGGDVRGG